MRSGLPVKPQGSARLPGDAGFDASGAISSRLSGGALLDVAQARLSDPSTAFGLGATLGAGTSRAAGSVLGALGAAGGAARGADTSRIAGLLAMERN